MIFRISIVYKLSKNHGLFIVVKTRYGRVPIEKSEAYYQYLEKKELRAYPAILLTMSFLEG